MADTTNDRGRPEGAGERLRRIADDQPRLHRRGQARVQVLAIEQPPKRDRDGVPDGGYVEMSGGQSGVQQDTAALASTPSSCSPRANPGCPHNLTSYSGSTMYCVRLYSRFVVNAGSVCRATDDPIGSLRSARGSAYSSS